jgi:hypothetical protein
MVSEFIATTSSQRAGDVLQAFREVLRVVDHGRVAV